MRGRCCRPLAGFGRQIEGWPNPAKPQASSHARASPLRLACGTYNLQRDWRWSELRRFWAKLAGTAVPDRVRSTAALREIRNGVWIGAPWLPAPW
jgi:hypothetical protein